MALSITHPNHLQPPKPQPTPPPLEQMRQLCWQIADTLKDPRVDAAQKQELLGHPTTRKCMELFPDMFGYAQGGLVKFIASKMTPPTRPFKIYDTPFAAEFAVAPQARTRLLSGRPLTEEELRSAEGLTTYPVLTRPGQSESKFFGDIQSAIDGKAMAKGGKVTASPEQISGYNLPVPSWDIFAEA